MPKKKSGLRPENKGGPKIEKKVGFWHKKCENFQIWNPIFFFSKKFQPTNAAEKALCTKRHFSNGNHSKKYISKIPKISKILPSYFSKKKIEKKIIIKYIFFPRRLRRLDVILFFGACGASFFFNRKMNFLRKKYLKKSKKNSRSIEIGGDQTCYLPHFWHVTLPLGLSHISRMR